MEAGFRTSLRRFQPRKALRQLVEKGEADGIHRCPNTFGSDTGSATSNGVFALKFPQIKIVSIRQFSYDLGNGFGRSRSSDPLRIYAARNWFAE
jgi:hypothetical protein